jgi:class 3 adenylate cyclase/CheY-like chemotaxis protein
LREPPLILVVDDHADNRDILEFRLGSQGWVTATAADGEEALAAARELLPDLILLDVTMPKLSGFEVCRRLKADPTLPFMPIILVTGRSATHDVVTGLEGGADEYLTKPFDHSALIARVRSILRIKELHDRVTAQAAELAAWNDTLERRVADQVEQLERMAQLRRFVAPQVAHLILASGGEALLESHRREVVVLFCDLRGFTAFGEQASPEEVMRVLGEYHETVGTLVHRHEGTLERFVGDGLMVLFNDPVPCADPEARAVRLARAIQARLGALAADWRGRGFALGCGIGIARGEATLGRIGFEGRFDYTAIGSVANLASRLCAEAADGQILVSAAIEAAVGTTHRTTDLGMLSLKGFQAPVRVFAIEGD